MTGRPGWASTRGNSRSQGAIWGYCCLGVIEQQKEETKANLVYLKILLKIVTGESKIILKSIISSQLL